MKKVIGYLLIVVGFLFVASGIGSSVTSNIISLPIPRMLSTILGLIFIISGLYMTWDTKASDKIEHVSSEVPIYEGEGKNRKIIAYKKVDSKK